MATGIVRYWNGESGWIKQDNAAGLTTTYARDILIMHDDVTSGLMAQESAVSYTLDAAAEPWQARSLTVS